jgi:hypothetical protein
MTEQLGICLNLARLAISQYANFNFNSSCEFNGKFLAANENGIFVLDSNNTDDGLQIEAFIETYMLDLNTQGRLRRAYLGYETTGALVLKVRNNETNERHYVFKPLNAERREHDDMVTIGRDGQGRYWQFRIENTGGCDFGLDSLEIIPIFLGKKPRK